MDGMFRYALFIPVAAVAGMKTAAPVREPARAAAASTASWKPAGERR
jgi:hypothetical protein